MNNYIEKVLSKRQLQPSDERFFKESETESKFFSLFRSEIEKIDSILKRSKRVVLYTDYDVDGLISLEILRTVIGSLYDIDSVKVIINERDDGYGILDSKLRSLDDASQTIIFSDLAIDEKAISVLRDFRQSRPKMKLIAIDHHHYSKDYSSTLDVFINSRLYAAEEEIFHSSAAKNVYKTFSSLIKNQELKKSLRNLVSVTLISDQIEFVYENRFFLKEFFFQERRLIGFLEKMIDNDDRELTIRKLAFDIIPRLNSFSRTNSIKKLLKAISKDSKEVNKLSQRLNQERKRIQNEAIEIANFQIFKKNLLIEDQVIIIELPERYKGVFGIVASRICSKYKKPCLVGYVKNDSFKGSFRDFYLKEPLIEQLSSIKDEIYLRKMEGHTRAGGFEFSISSTDEIRRKLNQFRLNLEMIQFFKTEETDLHLTFSEFEKNFDQIDIELRRKFFPFSENSIQPIKMKVFSIQDQIVKKNNSFGLMIRDFFFKLNQRQLSQVKKKDFLIFKIEDACSFTIE